MREEIQPRFWRPKQIAKLLSLSPSTVRRAIADGRLESIRVGGSILIPDEAIEKYVRGDGGRAA